MRRCVCRCAALAGAVALLVPCALAQRQRLPRAERLGADVELRRDPATGELAVREAAAAATAEAPDIRVRVSLAEVSVHVAGPDAAAVLGLGPEDFRLYEDGVAQEIVHFDAAAEPAGVVLLIDASPSIYRELARMKQAARALAAQLAARDEVAVVAFDAEAWLLLPFTTDRAQLERAIDSVRIATAPAGARGSHIYEAVYLAARRLFAERRGRKAIVLLTDGQDSGLGLGWDAGSMLPSPAAPDRLSFEDVCRALAAAGVEVHAISTMPRPPALTEAWLATQRDRTLISRATRLADIPHYTAYLAELVRRVGGRLWFLREAGGLEEIYGEIARTIRAQYTLGYYPSAGATRPGWRTLRIELPGRPGLALSYRFAYYVPAP